MSHHSPARQQIFTCDGIPKYPFISSESRKRGLSELNRDSLVSFRVARFPRMKSLFRAALRKVK